MSFECEHCGSTVSCLSQIGRGVRPHSMLEQKPFAWCLPGLNAFERGEECPAGWIGFAIPLYTLDPPDAPK